MKYLNALCVFLFFYCTTIFAVTVNTTFQVTATVTQGCTVSAQNLAFGDYEPLPQTTLDASTTVVVTCTNSTPYNIALSAGSGSGATVNVRKMTSAVGSHTLNYSLFSNSGRTTIWGNTVDTDTVAGTGTGLASTYWIYGRIFGNQATAYPGNYTDTISLDVIY